MTIVERTVSLSIPVEGMSLEDLEASVAEVLQQAGREVLLQACEQLQAGLLEDHDGRPEGYPCKWDVPRDKSAMGKVSASGVKVPRTTG